MANLLFEREGSDLNPGDDFSRDLRFSGVASWTMEHTQDGHLKKAISLTFIEDERVEHT